jgi:head-to-tail connecting protein
MDTDQNAIDVIAEQETAAGLRGEWEATCEQIALRILPTYARHFAGQNRSELTQSFRNTHEMVDSTGALALKRFAAAMESMNTPHTAKWHGILPADNPILRRNREVRLYFEDLTRLLFTLRYAPTSNFASQKYADYMMIGAFGNAILFTDALRSTYERGLRYRSIHPGQCYFMENHQGLIDKNFRRFPLTARQAVQDFGAANLPKPIVEQAADAKRCHLTHYFIHKVSPREDYDPERKDTKGMRFASCYVSLTDKKTVREGGYHTFPYAISRYSTLPGQVMGSSIAMMALPTIKTADEIKKTLLKQGHRTTDPILLAHDDGVADAVSFRPGSIVSGGVNADGKPLVQVLPTGNLAVGEKMLEQEAAIINDFFLVSLFRILVDSPQKTATQVIEETREKGMLLTPEIRQQAESLGPMIDRELDVLRDLRLLPPMPQLLLDAAGEYTIIYDNPMTRMGRSEELAGFLRMNEYSRDIYAVTQDPQVFDYYNYDVAMPAMADIQAVPVSWMNDLQKIKALRDGRAQQMQQEKMIQAAPALSNMAKQVIPPPQPVGTA